MDKDEFSKQYTEKCSKKCKEAIRLLKDITEKLLSGQITVKELEILTLYLSQAVELFSPEVVREVTNDPFFNVVETVEKRKCEVQKFKSYHFAVKTVLKYCENLLERGNHVYVCKRTKIGKL